MKRLTLHAEAQSELKAAVDYYEAIDPGLGRDLKARVHRAFREIRKTPARYPLYKERRIRRCPFLAFRTRSTISTHPSESGLLRSLIRSASLTTGEREP
jgi:hypothetical protein